MNRSPGITAVAVAAIIEGVFSCIFGLFALLGLAMMRIAPQLAQTSRRSAAVAVIVGIEVLIFLGIGTWTIASAIGVLRLKNWARISLTVIGGVFAVLNLFGMASAAIMTKVPVPPNTHGITPNTMAIMGGIFGAICLIQMGIGTWWVVYLNLRRVRAQFAVQTSASAYAGFQAPAVVMPPTIERPLSIMIIGWLMAVSGFLLMPFYFASNYPALILGMLIIGWAARAAYIAIGLACAGIGIGLIRLHPLSLQIAIGYNVFAAVNALAIFLFPSAKRRFLEISLQRLPPEQAWMRDMLPKFMWIGLAFGLALSGVQLWFLITRKEAYLAAARQREAAAPAA